MKNPLTTSAPIGVALRYLGTIIGAMLLIAGAFNWLSAEQVKVISAQMPELLTAIGGLLTICIPLYATLKQSSSDRARKIAREVDMAAAANEAITIKTPPGKPDVTIPPGR